MKLFSSYIVQLHSLLCLLLSVLWFHSVVIWFCLVDSRLCRVDGNIVWQLQLLPRQRPSKE